MAPDASPVSSVAALVVATAPFLASLASGRFDLPTTSVAESLSALAPSNAGGYRVLWLGRPGGRAARRLVGRAGPRGGDLDERPARWRRRSSPRPTPARVDVLLSAVQTRPAGTARCAWANCSPRRGSRRSW